MLPNCPGIYQILNRDTGKCYIGSAVNIRKRWTVHKTHLRKGDHHSRKLQNSWNKHGEASFELVVLQQCAVEGLLHVEQMYLDALHPQYNMAPTAGSGQGVKLSAEVKAAIAQRMKDRIAADPVAHARLCAKARAAKTEESHRLAGEAARRRHAARRVADPELQEVLRIAEQRGVKDVKGFKRRYLRDKQAAVSTTPRRRGEILECHGLAMTKKAWAAHLGITAGALTNRIKKFPLEQALSLPAKFRIGS